MKEIQSISGSEYGVMNFYLNAKPKILSAITYDGLIDIFIETTAPLMSISEPYVFMAISNGQIIPENMEFFVPIGPDNNKFLYGCKSSDFS